MSDSGPDGPDGPLGGGGEAGYPMPESINRHFVRGAKSVEFTADNGSQIQILW